MRQLTLEGRITVFKSKVIHLLLITKLYNDTIDLFYENLARKLLAAPMKKRYKKC